ncbi:sulfurtransferase [uncultured Limnohabitans sp.]|jgi:thiosulfate/3-mercaptopyruvate sulfurtransferase|uniref:sulfurtransferase n=1 Tax=uncultured Limnohabitans sp. TaxID=768543 RepID=UPI0026239B6F|nr:sulfurtransferase [uncultured Limnohabitans sp.]
MKRISALVLALSATAFSVPALAAQPLLSPAELQAKLSDANVRVIDIRDPKSFATNHIAGSVNAPYGTWRGPASNPGELPALPKLTTLVQSLGLTPSTHAVIVSSGADATDFGASARVYWTLKVLGLQDLSILNGGLKGWATAGLPQNNQAVKVAASSFQPQIDASLVATKEELVARVKSGDAALIDARPAEFFNGDTRHAAASVPGTLQGAVNVEHSQWFAPGTSTFVNAAQAQKVAASSPIDPAKETVSFCNTGHWAATNWFAMSEVLGQKNVKLYAGSMVEWSKDANGLPMANVPSRPKQLLIDTKLWAEKTFK